MYLVFAYSSHYPGGGSADFVGKYTSYEEAEKMALASKEEHAEVYSVDDDEWNYIK